MASANVRARFVTGALRLLTSVGLFAAQQSQAGIFQNKLFDGADPSMTYYNGFYYTTVTTGNQTDSESAIELWRFRSLGDFKTPSLIEKKKIIDRGSSYTLGDDQCALWASELQQVRNPQDGITSWYVTYTALPKSNSASCAGYVTNNHRLYSVQAVTSTGAPALDPWAATAWNPKGQIATTINGVPTGVAVDGTILQYPSFATNGLANNLYLIWSGSRQSDGQGQTLFIQRLTNPWTTQGDAVQIKNHDKPWEGSIVEAPETIISSGANGLINLTFSGNDGASCNYAVGRMTTEISMDPLVPGNWWVDPANPVFKQSGDACGPGHHSFMKSPNGSEDWIAFHAINTGKGGCGTCNSNREVRAQPVHFNGNRTVFTSADIPAQLNVSINLPAGDPGSAGSGANLLVNGNFETGYSAPWSINTYLSGGATWRTAGAALYSTSCHTPNYCFDAWGNGKAQSDQSVMLQAGHRYTLTATGQSGAVNDLTVGVTGYGIANQDLHLKSPGSNWSWTTSSITFIPASASGAVFLWYDGAGGAVVDSISLAGDPGSAGSGANLLVNGDFETGYSAPWSINTYLSGGATWRTAGAALYSTSCHTPNYCFDAWGNGKAQSDQSVMLQAGHRYTLTATGQSGAVNDLTVGVTGYGIANQDLHLKSPSSNWSWTTSSITFIPASASGAVFLWYDGAGGAVVDSISLVETP